MTVAVFTVMAGNRFDEVAHLLIRGPDGWAYSLPGPSALILFYTYGAWWMIRERRLFRKRSPQ